MATRTEAAKNRLRHESSGRFVKRSANGDNTKSTVRAPIGVSSDLARILRPQAAFRWLLPPVAAITPQYLEMVMRGALAGNHVQQWELFDLMFDTWPVLSQCQQELTYGVLSKKLVFEPYHEEDEKPTSSALERCGVVSTALRTMQPDADRDENALRGTISDLLDGWIRGLTVLEVIWHNAKDQQAGPIIAPKSTFWVHPVAFGFSQDGVLGLRTVSPYQPSGYAANTMGGAPAPQPYPSSYLQATPQPAVLQKFPDYKFLIGVHKAKAGTALAGPMLRPLAWWWLASNFASDWLLNLAQLFGLPFRYATYDPNAPDASIDAIFNMLQNMGTAGWAAFPMGTTLEFKETGGGRQAEWSPQGTLLDRADRYARELILGQTMTGSTMTSGKGGQAFGIVEKDVKGERIDAAGKFACDVINKQLIPAILELNYGDADEPPSVRLLEENEGQFVDAQRDQILRAIGLEIGVDFMRKKYGIPEPAADEEVLGAPQVQPQSETMPVGADGMPRRLDEKPTEEQQNLGASSENDTEQTMSGGAKEPPAKAGHGAYAPGHDFFGNQYTGGLSNITDEYATELVKDKFGRNWYAITLRDMNGKPFAYKIGYTRKGKPGISGERRILTTEKFRSEISMSDALRKAGIELRSVSESSKASDDADQLRSLLRQMEYALHRIEARSETSRELQSITIQTPPVDARTTVHVPAHEIFVDAKQPAAPPVNVTVEPQRVEVFNEAPQIEVQAAAAPPPPDVNVSVEPARVEVFHESKTPEVFVTVEPSPAPNVNVNVEPPDVTVENTVNVPPNKEKTAEIKRDPDGRISEINVKEKPGDSK